jgi:hypothetical protein
MKTYSTIYYGKFGLFGRHTVTVLPPQYDPEPPVRPVFKFIHGPVTRHGCRQSCYTVQIGAPA